MVDLEGVTTSYLLKRILQWYANPHNWQPLENLPINLNRSNRIIKKDKSKLAKKAVEASSIGLLISVVCDAYGISLTNLSKRSRISQSRIYDIVNGCDLTKDESISIRNTFDIID